MMTQLNFSEIPNWVSNGRVGEDRILKVESELGVEFPDDYRAFILEHGAGFGEGIEIFGIAKEKPDKTSPLFQSVLDTTKSIRENGYPKKLIGIGHDGFSSTFCIDTEEDKNGLNPVLVIGPYENGKVASCFSEFVQKITSAGYESLST